MAMATAGRPSGIAPQLRQMPVRPDTAALLVIDMQKGFANPAPDADPHTFTPGQQYFFGRLKDVTIPAIQKLLQAFREKNGEIIYTHVEGLTKDGRDQSLDYKLTGHVIPKGAPGAQILDELKPQEDEIRIPKTACSVFNSTNIEYVLRNLGVTQLVICGIKTNQCVDSAIRDAADRGFLVTLVEDACATMSQEEHDASLYNMKGFSRICDHQQIVREVGDWPVRITGSGSVKD